MLHLAYAYDCAGTHDDTCVHHPYVHLSIWQRILDYLSLANFFFILIFTDALTDLTLSACAVLVAAEIAGLVSDPRPADVTPCSPMTIRSP